VKITANTNILVRSLLVLLDSWQDDLGEDEQLPPIDDPPPEPVDL
jgi:hypothetical protein